MMGFYPEEYALPHRTGSVHRRRPAASESQRCSSYARKLPNWSKLFLCKISSAAPAQNTNRRSPRHSSILFAVSAQWSFPSKYYQRNPLPIMLRCEPKTAPPPLTISSMIVAPSANDWHHYGKCWRCRKRYDPYLLLYCSRILQLFSVVSLTNHDRGRYLSTRGVVFSHVHFICTYDCSYSCQPLVLSLVL